METNTTPNSSAAPVPTTERIESILDAIVIHNDKPIENIPSIAAPELKLIGRCVTFIGDTLIQGEMKPMHYEGLVATITHDTVMLIYVFRYTPENYETHVQNHSDYGESAKQFILSLPGNKAHLVSLGIYTEESVPSANACNSESSNCTQSQPQPQMYDQHLEDDDASMRCVLHNMNTSTHIGGERDSTQDINSEASITSQSRNRFLNITGSIGPIPYMTFTRTHIHSVKFAHDPQSNFYSLFRNPDKRFFDLQCLRMFVRRYVIHTSQENNPRKASLQSFLTHRCNCTYINEELLHGMVREEVAHLMKIDRDMKRAQCTLARHNRDAYLNYRAPAGLFRRTGILYLTGFPSYTAYLAVVELLVVLILFSFFFLSKETSRDALSQRYFCSQIIYVSILSATCFFAACVTFVHATHMSIAQSKMIDLMICRISIVSTCFFSSVLSTVMLALSTSKSYITRYIMTRCGLFNFEDFMRKHECIFTDAICSSDNSTSNTRVANLTADSSAIILYNYSCEAYIRYNTIVSVMPLLILSVFATILALCDHFMHYKLVARVHAFISMSTNA